MNPADLKLSVVIASVVGAPFIDKCIASLDKQVDASMTEVIVVGCTGEQTAARIASRFPWVKLIQLQSRETIPILRRRAVEHARGEIVALIEEHCVADKSWIKTLLKAHEGTAAVVGGPVADNNYERLRDWVTFFTEYNSYLPPMPEGETDNLAGANIAYKKRVLLENLDLLDRGYWEASLHPKLLAEGKKLLSVPAMVVRHTGPFNYGYYLYQRYLFSRAFAGVRRKEVPGRQRLLYLLAAPALPLLLLGRMAARVWRRPQYRGKFLRTLPLLVPVVVTYVFGEWLGYLLGPGDTLLKIE